MGTHVGREACRGRTARHGTIQRPPHRRPEAQEILPPVPSTLPQAELPVHGHCAAVGLGSHIPQPLPDGEPGVQRLEGPPRPRQPTLHALRDTGACRPQTLAELLLLYQPSHVAGGAGCRGSQVVAQSRGWDGSPRSWEATSKRSGGQAGPCSQLIAGERLYRALGSHSHRMHGQTREAFSEDCTQKIYYSIYFLDVKFYVGWKVARCMMYGLDTMHQRFRFVGEGA